MTRFIGQTWRCATSCVTIGIINALKYHGVKLTTKDMSRINKYIEKPVGGGVQFSTKVLPALSHFGDLEDLWYTHGCDTDFKLEYIDHQLSKGNAVFLNYHWMLDQYQRNLPRNRYLTTGMTGHCMLIIGKKGNNYICVNSGTKHLIGTRRPKWIQTRLDFKHVVNEIHGFAIAVGIPRKKWE